MRIEPHSCDQQAAAVDAVFLGNIRFSQHGPCSQLCAGDTHSLPLLLSLLLSPSLSLSHPSLAAVD